MDRQAPGLSPLADLLGGGRLGLRGGLAAGQVGAELLADLPLRAALLADADIDAGQVPLALAKYVGHVRTSPKQIFNF
jgi:hypothetical protein